MENKLVSSESALGPNTPPPPKRTQLHVESVGAIVEYHPDPSMLVPDGGSIDHEDLDAKVITALNAPLRRMRKKGRQFIDVDGKVDPEWKSFLVEDVLGNVYLTFGRFPLLPELKGNNDLEEELDKIVQEHPDIVKWAYQALCDNTFRTLRLLAIIRPPPPPGLPSQPQTDIDLDPSAGQATIKSWSTPFRGQSAELLHKIMTSYIQRVSVGSIDPYAIVIAHVQSSGTGKSRMHDELAKHIVYVPICLASHSQSAYPPPDRKIRNWLFDSAVSTADGEPDLPGTQKRLQGLVYAVLTVTKKHLVEIQNDPELGIPSQQISNIAVQNGKLPMGTVDADVPVMIATLSRLSRLASAFREKMSAGGSFTKHGEYREEFYKEVCRVADEFVRNGQPQAVNTDGSPTDVYSSQGGTVSGAADELRTFLDPLGLCGERLLAVICMDEAHKLTDSIHSVEWNRFTELRRPLRKIRHQPFATVFLSTTGSFHKFSQDNADETSSRLRRKKLALFDPITEVGFDQFAVKVLVGDSKWTLDRLASTHHIAHLGRALFATRYDTGSDETRRDIVAFAREKLLYGLQEGQSLNGDMKLACLSVRLGLEFKATNWAERTAERKQVENHMRVCLSATAGFHTMTTISPSEPLLAEAASRDMAEPSWNAPGALLAHIETSYLNPGDRGEVLATLILLLARDTAAKTTHLPVPVQGGALDVDGLIKRRVVSVPEFLGALFGDRGVLKMKPSKWMNDETRDTLLENAFGDGRIWFNHFVKVNDFNVLNRKYLAGLIARGAAVICANNQRGVDILIPILLGTTLDLSQVSAILIQVKNDKSYGTTIEDFIFEGMDPFTLGLFPRSNPRKKGSKSRQSSRAPKGALRPPATDSTHSELPPVIRLAFALASSDAAVLSSEPDLVGSKFTAYDIWCAGISPDTFGPVQWPQMQTYEALLLRSRNITDAYNQPSPGSQVVNDRSVARRRLHPAVGTHPEHFLGYIDLHPVDSQSADALLVDP